MAEPTLQELEKIWDRIIGLGPFGIGMDGIIAMLNNPLSGPLAPLGIAADEIYTWGAGLYLLFLAFKAHASGWTMIRMIFYLIADSLVGLIPFLGGPIDFLFQGTSTPPAPCRRTSSAATPGRRRRPRRRPTRPE